MKMSDVFFDRQEFTHAPLDRSKPTTSHLDTPIELSITPSKLNQLNVSQMAAIEHAVNNHDALVESLDSLIDDFEPWGSDNYCKSCRARVTHKDDCDYKADINLLDKIKGESKL